jgi:2-dehydro-3-deoxyphosphogalactonate aldolase
MNQLQGIVAILRGLTPPEALDIGHALVRSGVRIIEVPLNSPEPYRSIEILARALEGRALIGAGTVLRPEEADRIADAGARLMVAPNFDAAVLARCRARGLVTMPGVATPSEGFAALAAGADGLKLFPGEMLGPPVLKAWRAVFPSGTPMFPVGGVGEHNLAAYRNAGAAGAGIGSSLYAPGVGAAEVGRRAAALVACWNAV